MQATNRGALMTLPTAAERPTLSIEEAAEALGVSRATAYTAAKEERIPAIRVSAGRIVVPTAALRRLLGLDEPVPAA